MTRVQTETVMDISVIVPVYNGEDVIGHCADCLLKSGLKSFEIILVDDGSQDDTPTLIDALAAAHDNIRCIHQRNAGVSSARNRGLESARGNYILFFDADDSVDEGSLQGVEKLLDQEDPDMLIFGMRFDYYFRGRLYRQDQLSYPQETCFRNYQWAAQFSELFQMNMLSSSCNRVIRRDILSQNGLRFMPSLHILEDLLFVAETLRFCPKVYMLPKPIYRYNHVEEQRKTFERVSRIPSLNGFMQPFEKAIRQLGETTTQVGTVLSDGPSVLGDIYSMLLQQQLTYADRASMQRITRELQGSAYANAVQKKTPKLYWALTDGEYGKLSRTNRALALRHRLAVCVKYVLSFRSSK